MGGDIRKLRTAKKLSPPLSKLSKRMLQSMEGTAKKIEGTHQTRSMMRYELCAYRVNKGLPIFITWSPNERHNALMIRMSRTRMSDPLAKHCKQHKHWGKINEPRADGGKDDSNTNNTVLGEVSVDALIDTLPNTDVRRKILAKDPLASVYGFRLLCKITLSALFGGRVCSKCPECNHGEHGCVDMFGSVAKAEGGISGRMEAFYGSIENQKEDSQHLHTMIWLQSMYQQKTLIEIAQMIRDNTDLVTDTHAFSEHVCQESYHKPSRISESKGTRLKRRALNTLHDDCLFQHKSLPDNNATCDVQASAQSPAVVAGGVEWAAAYKCDVQQVGMRVNHHIHRVSDVTKEREPMPYCRCKGKPHECSKGYPKTKIDLDADLGGDKGAVVCKGLASRFNLKSTGSRSMLGTIKTQRNNEWLNGTHPALLHKLRCNSDVQVTYRMPLIKETHCSTCKDVRDCLSMTFTEQMRIQQQSQRNQIGYITDYISKKQPLAIKEIDKFVEGHKKLQEISCRGGIGKECSQAHPTLAVGFLWQSNCEESSRNNKLVSMPTGPRRYSSREFEVALACCFPVQRLRAFNATAKEMWKSSKSVFRATKWTKGTQIRKRMFRN